MYEIETNRLWIRRFKPEDWWDLYEYLSDRDVIKYEPYDVFTEDECKTEAMKRAKDDAFLAVCIKPSLKLIGNIYLGEREFDTWELGYVFHKDFHGKGYATESCEAVIKHAFTNLKARRIIAHCNPENTSSWSLLERLHMRREGHLRKNIYFKTDEHNNPIWLDTYEYGILAEEWELRS
ncbi:GNAT family N-acetyltransferase [Mobilitalea sibirica]|uniref:GNAT family N-acetyltransferase n=1 Tax=Mobilitalea sibirica TaxID=1462919 RepID=A0A8J7L2I5_9FIRM|nr:GNAT family N-acetyltransferase [Mobilitalea sibirica]MBH1940688.1 GNAT family N-acetyltransferase [Mobilitalea sibirica]